MEKRPAPISKQTNAIVIRRPIKIGILGPPEARVLDLAGPWEVFSRVNEVLAERQLTREPGYQLRLASAESSRSINCLGGFNIQVVGDFRTLGLDLDTLLVAGGRATWELPKNAARIAWLQQVSLTARRIAAIGSGAFLLAEAGLLRGKRVTTHWRWAERLQRSYASILVDPQPAFIQDGRIYTSAGVAVSIDLSLALAEEDYGHPIATEVAKRLVIFVHRPASQAQVSRALVLQGSEHDRFRDLGVWIANHLDEDLSVEALAKRSAMSVRNFSRRFHQSFGVTPAEFVTRMRVETACRRLAESTFTLEQIAAECGFSSAELLRRACHRILGDSPERFRVRD